MKGTIVVVDDNKHVLSTLRILLGHYFEEVCLLPSPNHLVATIKEKNPDVALLDMNYSAGINSGNEGLFWLAEIKKVKPELPVVLFTAYADIDLAVRALKEGAIDFVVKPWDNMKLIATLQSACALSESRKEVRKLKEKQNVMNLEINREEVCWGKSKEMRGLLDVIRKVAPTDANVLITGENGTGKEVVARAIHNYSGRHDETMVTVDMGSITDSLFESELFGHTRGSFTDAKSDRAGKFEAADKGTLFLDEIGNLNVGLQAKLLAALQSRKIVRVGSNRPIEVDIRLICATNADLHQRVGEGRFREDLLYRINTIQLEVPPLRDRAEDIALLADFFLRRFKVKYNKPALRLSPESVAKLERYAWPGNVRELQHAVEKAVILGEETELCPDDFFIRTAGRTEEPAGEGVTLDEMEKRLIRNAMDRHHDNVSAVAAELGVSRPTLYNKLKKYGL